MGLFVGLVVLAAKNCGPFCCFESVSIIRDTLSNGLGDLTFMTLLNVCIVGEGDIAKHNEDFPKKGAAADDGENAIIK